jgi:hypothetical protein
MVKYLEVVNRLGKLCKFSPKLQIKEKKKIWFLKYPY